jgi:hypothetical protein
MSPAQRKSAKPRRSATRTARATSTRGKPPGSALAKAMKVKGKTPAKRGSHRKAGRVNGSGAGCDMRREELELLLDREGGRGEVITHVPGCHPCATSLTVIAAQRDAVRHLTAEPSGTTAVDFLLERGARSGEKVLANLVYELAKACLVVARDVARRLHLGTTPRARSTIAASVRDIAGRMEGGTHRDLSTRQLPEAGAEADALIAAESCIAILQRLEGPSERQRLARAVCLICSNRPAEAEALLEQMIELGVSATGQLHAYRNLLWSLIRQDKYGRLLSLEPTVLAALGNDWDCVFNLVVAAANSGNTSLFKKYAALLRRVHAEAEPTKQFRNSVMTYEVPRLAHPMGMPESDVAKSLGVAISGRARDVHEVA